MKNCMFRTRVPASSRQRGLRLAGIYKKLELKIMINDSKQENKVWHNGSGHEQNARASGCSR